MRHARCAAVAVVLASTAAISASAADQPDEILLRVVAAESGAPIAGAALAIEHDFGEGRAAADQNGLFRIDIPKAGVTYLQIVCEAPNRVTMRQHWRWQSGGLALPAELVLPMPQGVTAGGLVVNEQGAPVGNVLIVISASGRGGSPRPWVRRHELATDAHGRWTCAILPADMRRLVIELRHPDYVPTWHTATARSDPSLEAFRDEHAVLTLEDGVTVWGRVITEAGEPVEGATIEAGRFSDGYTQPIATSRKDGRYRFTVERDDLAVMVRAEHLSPVILRVPKQKIESPIEVRLKPGGVIRGRVMDLRGEAIAGADVRVAVWAGSSQDWRFRTDEDGTFIWDSAPLEGDIEMRVEKGGYITKRRVPMKPGNEFQVTLPDALVVHGRVMDAEMMEPLPRFKVTPAYEQRPELPLFYATDAAVEGIDGEFVIGISEEHTGVFLVIDAEGHLPAKSRRFEVGEGERRWDTALERGEGPSAIVRGPNGGIVAGAEVHRTTHQSCEVFDGRSFLGNTAVSTTTDEFGRFGFPPSLDQYAVIVLTDDGYAIATDEDLREQQVIHLQPWSRIEGRYLVALEPGAEQTIEMMSFNNGYDLRPDFVFRSTVTTDRDGRFMFDRAPAGLVEVKRMLARRRTFGGIVQREMLELEPGRTEKVQLGGRGRSVAGRIVPAAGLDTTRTWTYAGYASLRTADIDWAYPADYASWSDEKQREWWLSWRKTDECAAILERRFRENRAYHFEISPDGAFRIEDVLPGFYHLVVRVEDPDSLLTGIFGDPLGVIEKDVSIREPDASAPMQVFDLGSLELELSTKVPIGEVAPEFEFATVDGETMGLSDFRGRYVLLDFWATWCAPCVTELPEVKKVYDLYREKGLEVIGLSLDVGPEAPKALFDRGGYGWVQGFLGKNESVVTRKFGVVGIPVIILLDPEGRVIARDLRGSAIGEAVAHALGDN